MRIVNKGGFPLKYATDGSVGLDLHASIGTYRDIEVGRRFLFDTGISIELNDECCALVQPRSGLALHHGILTSTGVIDRDYRGTVKVLLFNHGQDVYRVHPGDRIAQLLIVRSPPVDIEEVEELDITDRGLAGFGSTGR